MKNYFYWLIICTLLTLFLANCTPSPSISANASNLLEMQLYEGELKHGVVDVYQRPFIWETRFLKAQPEQKVQVSRTTTGLKVEYNGQEWKFLDPISTEQEQGKYYLGWDIPKNTLFIIIPKEGLEVDYLTPVGKDPFLYSPRYLEGPIGKGLPTW